MEGERQLIRCSCGKAFTYWVKRDEPHPKVKCYFCGLESYPRGAPPAPVEPPKPPEPAKPAVSPAGTPKPEPQPVH